MYLVTLLHDFDPHAGMEHANGTQTCRGEGTHDILQLHDSDHMIAVASWAMNKVFAIILTQEAVPTPNLPVAFVKCSKAARFVGCDRAASYLQAAVGLKRVSRGWLCKTCI